MTPYLTIAPKAGSRNKLASVTPKAGSAPKVLTVAPKAGSRTKLATFTPAPYVFVDPAQAYQRKVIALQNAAMLGYWPLAEPSGTTINDVSGRGNHGAYANVSLGQTGIGDGQTCPLFTPASLSVGNLYSAALRTAFNGNTGTAMVWLKVSAAGAWTDSLAHYGLGFEYSGSNYVSIFKPTSSSRITLGRRGAGQTASAVTVSTSSTGWMHLALTWSTAANEMKGYYNGTQSGSTQACAGSYASVPAINKMCLGGYATDSSSYLWPGYVAHVALWNIVLTSDEIAILATVS